MKLIHLFILLSLKISILQADYPQYIGKKIYAGSHQSRGGEKRSDKKGGFYIGEKSKNFRGVQIHNEGNSGWLFVKEKSNLNQSLLVTLQPNPLTVNAISVKGTNMVKANVNDFSNSFFSKDVIVDFGLQRYRIIKKKDNETLSLCLVKRKKCIDFKFDTKIQDNLILPAFYFQAKGHVEDNILKFLSGDYPPRFSKFAYRHKQVSVYINGEWFFLKKQVNKLNYQFLEHVDDTKIMNILLRFQPSYTVELVLKRTSGQGLEESWMVRSDYDAWRYKSSGSGMAFNKPHIFRVGNKDVLEINEDYVYSKKKIITSEIHLGDKDLDSSVRILSGKGNPNGRIKSKIGSIYIRKDGPKGEVLYIKESSTKTSLGWVAK